MNRTTLLQRWRRATSWLTLDRRLSASQPWVFLLGPIALALALLAPYQGLFVVAYCYILLVVVMYVWVRQLGPRVRLKRHLLSEWAQVGDQLEEQWELQNSSWLPLLWLEIEDATTLPGYAGRRAAGIGAGMQQQWLTTARCERRGVYSIGPLTASLGDPFGLFRYAWQEEQVRQIVIYPPLVRLPPLLVPQGQRGGLARADILQQYVTPSVGGLREYVRGDPPSHVHWPTVARTDKLMVKEFDQERAGAFWIALDLCTAGYQAESQHASEHEPREALDPYAYTQTSAFEAPQTESRPDSPLELAIVLACSLASQALGEGRAVGLLADDGRQRLVMPGRGPRQLWRILGALVDAQATGVLPFAEVLRQGHAARATELAGAALAVVTPALDGGWLPALVGWQRGRAGSALALLVADRAATALPLEARLAASGVGAQTFEVGAALPLLNPPKVQSTARLSPLGKVIRTG